jgi:ubiquinol-cytochrome c reductase cytochrome b subunit
MNRILSWIDKRFPLVSTWKTYLSDYYVANNLNLYYCFGALALVVLFNQLLTGLWLTMFYTPTIQDAFHSIQFIVRDVNYGWLLRNMHATGASAFFVVLYVHMFRGMLYGSYQNPRELVWLLGMMLFMGLMLEAFFGYLLPWGQLSYWGAQVVTSVLGAIPYVGESLLLWLRGDYTIGQATLQRFFALHIIGVPLMVLVLVYLHIVALHQVGSNNPQGIDIEANLDEAGKPLDGVPFYPYYVLKDCLVIVVFAIIFFTVVFFYPDGGGLVLEAANFAPADPLVTPAAITPAWYLAPFYAMLRAIPNKFLGILVVLSALLMFFVLPWLDNSSARSMRYKGMCSKIALFLWVVSFIGLIVLGKMELTELTLNLSRVCLFLYFFYFVAMPLYSRYERIQLVPARTSSL